MDITGAGEHAVEALQRARLGRFVAALGASVNHRCADGSAVRRSARLALLAIDVSRAIESRSPSMLPACGWLPTAISRLTDADGDLVELGRSIAALAPVLAWYRRTGLAAGPEFADGHANAIVFGPQGLVHSNDVLVGVTVMAPHVLYGDHHHPPEEVYLVLSSGAWRQHDGPWSEPGIGGIVHNPPDIVHSMRSGADPLLAVWILPTPSSAHVAR